MHNFIKTSALWIVPALILCLVSSANISAQNYPQTTKTPEGDTLVIFTKAQASALAKAVKEAAHLKTIVADKEEVIKEGFKLRELYLGKITALEEISAQNEARADLFKEKAEELTALAKIQQRQNEDLNKLLQKERRRAKTKSALIAGGGLAACAAAVLTTILILK